MKKLIFGILVPIIVFILVVVIALVVVINMTPRKLHLAELKLGSYTVEELGLADTKLITIYKNFTSIGKPNESEIVKNGFDKNVESAAADESFANSSLADTEDYSSIVNATVVYDRQYVVEYSDKTLAYIFDNIITNASESDEAIKYLHDADVKIKELSVTVAGGKGHVRIVAYIELAELKAEVEKEIGAAKSFVKVPDVIYIVSEQNFTVGTDGKMETEAVSLTLNGKTDDPVGNAVLKIALAESGGSTTDKELNDKLGEALASVIYNLGQIGTAETDADKVVTGDVNLGFGGVSDHKITVITHVAA